MSDSEYITKSTAISSYGLTESLLKKMGEPDKTAPNPHYRSAAPMKLYLRDRVEKFVEENQEAIEKILARRKKLEEAKPPPPPPPRAAPEYRKNVRQIGDKWSWSVYQGSVRRVLKSGWADSEGEAKAACDDIVKAVELEKYEDYFEYDPRRSY